jgi:hypothetical protein
MRGATVRKKEPAHTGLTTLPHSAVVSARSARWTAVAAAAYRTSRFVSYIDGSTLIRRVGSPRFAMASSAATRTTQSLSRVAFTSAVALLGSGLLASMLAAAALTGDVLENYAQRIPPDSGIRNEAYPLLETEPSKFLGSCKIAVCWAIRPWLPFRSPVRIS